MNWRKFLIAVECIIVVSTVVSLLITVLFTFAMIICDWWVAWPVPAISLLIYILSKFLWKFADSELERAPQ